jgi:hypothetical protein
MPAIILFDHKTGEQIAKATVNLPGKQPTPGFVFIKDWSENEGMYQALLDAGLIGETMIEHGSGFVMVKECPMTEKTLQLEHV